LCGSEATPPGRAAPYRGGATPRAGGHLSAAAGCGEHTVRWSPTVTATGAGAAIGPVALRKRARRHLRRPAGTNAVVRPAPGCDARRDSDVDFAIARRSPATEAKRLSRSATSRGRGPVSCLGTRLCRGVGSVGALSPVARRAAVSSPARVGRSLCMKPQTWRSAGSGARHRRVRLALPHGGEARRSVWAQLRCSSYGEDSACDVGGADLRFDWEVPSSVLKRAHERGPRAGGGIAPLVCAAV